MIATELLIVFSVISLRRRHMVQSRDWLAALGMAASLGAFLGLAHSARGHGHASGSMWVLAGISVIALADVLILIAYLPSWHGARLRSGRSAALLGMAAGAGFGFGRR
jgi:predicted cobalt transporter CbtA